MNRRRRYAKEALHVGLRGSHTMERCVCLDERQVLALEVGELGPSFYYALTCRHRDSLPLYLVPYTTTLLLYTTIRVVVRLGYWCEISC